ncbi:MAG: carboxypeptidase regulatory-like domain-containing protein [Blastocatellia bacterium]
MAGRGSAQTAGRITGQVMDSSQALIPGAAVTAQNVANGQRRGATTDSQGRYVIADVSVGTYKLTVEQKGFQAQARNDVQVNVAATVTVDFTLQPGQVSEVVQVSGELSTIEATQTSGGVMNNKSLTELPINGRDYAWFGLLIPGAVARSNFIADLSFNGLHTVHNQFQIDGIDASRVDQPYMANGFERGARLLTGSLDTIAEFRVQTSNYSAEYGRASGFYINIATKSGGNQIHFTLFEFFRNSALDARNYFANTGPKPPFRFNDFGGNVGGPINKDKMFYFVNYEGSRLKRLTDMSARGWYSGSTHVHMNYGGSLHNTLENLLMMSAAEDQDVVNELIANKDNRILDYQFFVKGGGPHPLSRPDRLLMVGQEYRPDFYGHVFMMGLRDHLISPFTTGYEGTAIKSLYPSNTDMLRKAKAQGATVGYVHAFGEVVETIPLSGDRRSAEFQKQLRVTHSGWYHLRAEGIPAERYPLDAEYAQAFTNPVWIKAGHQPVRNRAAAEYAIKWIDQLQQMAAAWPGWRSQQEREHVFAQFEEARQVYRRLAREAETNGSDKQ